MIIRWSIRRSISRQLHKANLASPRVRLPVSYSSTARSTEQTISTLLSKPTWSIRSLLPAGELAETPDITSKQLHHLLRLSALPPPKDAAEEKEMLETLQSQLHFVKKIQSVNTEGLEPLQSIHDETIVAREENELKLEDLAQYMKDEARAAGGRIIVKSRHIEPAQENEAEDWNVLGQASRTAGKYFVVEGGVPRE